MRSLPDSHPTPPALLVSDLGGSSVNGIGNAGEGDDSTRDEPDDSDAAAR